MKKYRIRTGISAGKVGFMLGTDQSGKIGLKIENKRGLLRSTKLTIWVEKEKLEEV